ncbi:class I SAM-dependent methyltransferase [Neolewinella aurantiaca]|uniref:Class I SAM-dependent methyltransferase n=1 Tax=Neolewinella aurantiaca TaxID=2602767 RepID=A0A5C7FX04_9BACT|nr:class I SAM-dependent methyltransferase [Neolewinella aurantiaca]TXF90970.1 class I SAM-dependent methyltransferase [Neolewinella aurantiaca]
MALEFIKDITIRKHYLLKLWWDRKSGFLEQSGWIRSFEERKCVDADGQPVPWLTYSLNKILDNRLGKEVKVYEFGSGFSTLFFAKRVKHVYTIEYDKKWYDLLIGQLPENTTIDFSEFEQPGYVANIIDVPELFDLIVIDGRRRNECAANAINKVAEGGVIIFDDTHRDKYREGTKLIEDLGYKRLDFWGFVNGSIDLKCTSVFYKANNILNI